MTAVYGPERLFNSAFIDTANNVIPFEEKWANGTGYFDHIVNDELGLKPGKMTQTISDDNRRIIIIGTRFGNVAVFEHHSHATNGLFTFNGPKQLMLLNVSRGVLDETTMGYLVGPWSGDNVGHSIEQLFAQ